MTDAFAESRDRYLGPLAGDGVFCVGNAAECAHYTEDGAVRIPWGGTPRTEDVPRIRALALCPTAAQLEKNVDVFAHLAAPLLALEIGGTGRDVPVAGLAALPTLETVRLTGLRAEIDCAVFRQLPARAELIVLNSKKITNVDALLDCRKLASITFVNCGNPFRKDGKARFAARGFANLDIAYS